MTRYIVARVAWAVMVIMGVTLVTFLVFFVLPRHHDEMFWLWTHGAETSHGDRLRAHLFGLDRSVWAQYATFVRSLLLGDATGWPGLGYSLSTREPLTPIVLSRFLVSLQVMGGAALLWLLVATPLGIGGALGSGPRADRITLGFVLVGVSCPVFLLGDIGLFVFHRLHLVTSIGFVPLGQSPLVWFGHLLLPWVVLSFFYTALYTRMLRASMSDVLSQDYIRTARAFGASERRVVVKHALRASAPPIVTMLGMDLGTLIGSVIIVEKIFNLPGLGNYVLQAVSIGDLSAMAAVTVVAAVMVTVANMVVDIAYALLDPRVPYRA